MVAFSVIILRLRAKLLPLSTYSSCQTRQETARKEVNSLVSLCFGPLCGGPHQWFPRRSTYYHTFFVCQPLFSTNSYPFNTWGRCLAECRQFVTDASSLDRSLWRATPYLVPLESDANTTSRFRNWRAMPRNVVLSSQPTRCVEESNLSPASL